MRLFVLISLSFGIQVIGTSLFEQFDDWKAKFGKVIDRVDEDRVYGRWVENHKYIEDINSRNLTYTLGHNEYSGMNSEEFSKYFSLGFNKIYGIDVDNKKKDIEDVRCVTSCVRSDEKNVEKIKCVKHCLKSVDSETLPDSVDWVSKGAVTAVKNQGQCGSCWSFSTTGALEGAYSIKNGNLQEFSEQELVDCDNFKNGGSDHGCNGGLMDNAFAWIKKNGGLCTENEYPYVSGTTTTSGTCDKSCTNVKGSDIISYTDVSPNSDESMMAALTKQPVSVAIQADQKDFQLYSSGVFTGSCGTQLDHGVLLVGYGSETNEDYYVIKNSWGNTWGDNGYIKIGRGSQYNDGNGQCGVLMQGSYPTV